MHHSPSLHHPKMGQLGQSIKDIKDDVDLHGNQAPFHTLTGAKPHVMEVVLSLSLIKSKNICLICQKRNKESSKLILNNFKEDSVLKKIMVSKRIPVGTNPTS